MKLQFLGDSKDCFKWDYHDFLTTTMDYRILNVAFMMTPDEGNTHGQTDPALFTANQRIVNFCEHLRVTRDPKYVSSLPQITSSRYEVKFHRPDAFFSHPDRYQYFSGASKSLKQILLLDPDNGFEPEKSISEKHVSFQDVFRILDQTPECSLISVFHHFRRISLSKDYSRIKERLNGYPSTAIHWNNSLMFVGVSKSEDVIKKARAANLLYSQRHSKVSVL